MPATFIPIATSIVTSASSQVTISSIPSTYDHLIVRCSTRTSAAVNISSFTLRFNSDSGSNYYGGYIFSEGTVAGGSSGSGTSHSTGGTIYMAGANVFNDLFSINELTIFNYKNTSYKKTIGHLSGVAGDAAGFHGVGFGGGIWNSTSAITSIDFLAGGGNFVVGSSFRLYGISNS